MPFKFSSQEAKQAFDKTLTIFQERLSRVHSGRVTPALVENISVSYQGYDMKLMELASIHLEGGRTLVIEPWDKMGITDIEKALLKSSGAAPQIQADKIYLTFSPLTDETREKITKEIKQFAEEERIRIRQIREEFWELIKEAETAKEIGQDDKFRFKEKLQEVVDEYNGKVEEIVEKKIESLR